MIMYNIDMSTRTARRNSTRRSRTRRPEITPDQVKEKLEEFEQKKNKFAEQFNLVLSSSCMVACWPTKGNRRNNTQKIASLWPMEEDVSHGSQDPENLDIIDYQNEHLFCSQCRQHNDW